jgi:3-deoxy-7-phosphoheptulonate synthase
MLADVANPVGCKVGPSVEPAELVELCHRLDPRRLPGRLTLISRMGVDSVSDRLSPLVVAVRRAGHPVIWLCDPMHGNTLRTPDGLKTRLVADMTREVELFAAAVARGGGVAGGLHLEATPDSVTECAQDAGTMHQVGVRYTSMCDPRLDPEGAVAVVSAWPVGVAA